MREHDERRGPLSSPPTPEGDGGGAAGAGGGGGRRPGVAERRLAEAREREQRRRRVRIVLAVLLVLSWVYVIFGSEGLLTQWNRHEQRDALIAELEAERARSAAMAREVEALRSDDLAIETAIRAHLDYQREGELVLIVEDDDPLERGRRRDAEP